MNRKHLTTKKQKFASSEIMKWKSLISYWDWYFRSSCQAGVYALPPFCWFQQIPSFLDSFLVSLKSKLCVLFAALKKKLLIALLLKNYNLKPGCFVHLRSSSLHCCRCVDDKEIVLSFFLVNSSNNNWPGSDHHKRDLWYCHYQWHTIEIVYVQAYSLQATFVREGHTRFYMYRNEFRMGRKYFFFRELHRNLSTLSYQRRLPEELQMNCYNSQTSRNGKQYRVRFADQVSASLTLFAAVQI